MESRRIKNTMTSILNPPPSPQKKNKKQTNNKKKNPTTINKIIRALIPYRTTIKLHKNIHNKKVNVIKETQQLILMKSSLGEELQCR